MTLYEFMIEKMYGTASMAQMLGLDMGALGLMGVGLGMRLAIEHPERAAELQKEMDKDIEYIGGDLAITRGTARVFIEQAIEAGVI